MATLIDTSCAREYLWTDVNGRVRSKTRMVPHSNIPCGLWTYDGSSTGQAEPGDSDVVLRPCREYNDPFRDPGRVCGDSLVLCDTLLPDGSTPHNTNTRQRAVEVLDRAERYAPMFGAEQEFFLVNQWTGLPDQVMGSGSSGLSGNGRHYCGVGTSVARTRVYAEEVLERARAAGISLTGMNLEVAQGQCEFQVCAVGIRAADDLIVLRYIMERVGEGYGYDISYEPKLISGDSEFNGSGCHVNFSTQAMREQEAGAIQEAIDRLALHHNDYIHLCGTGNSARLTGTHETSSSELFTWGRSDRSASVRIPLQFGENGGDPQYIEDRRPGANIDPYIVFSAIVSTVCDV